MTKSNLAERIELPETITEELRFIQTNNNGTLLPYQVVEYAKDPNTLLHKKFEWEDSVAAYQHRLWQARQVIRLELIVVDRKSETPGKIFINMDPGEAEEGKATRAFISLSIDRRGEAKNGYRSIEDVVSDEYMRAQMLEDARKDMNLFRRKYNMLKELSEVFDAMDKV